METEERLVTIQGEVSNDALSKYSSLLETKRYSDIIFKNASNSKTYHLHKFILLNASIYFRKLFNSSFQESTAEVIEANFYDPKDCFSFLIQYWYTGQVTIPRNKIIPLRKVAAQFYCQEIIDFTNSYIIDSAKVEIFYKMYEQSIYNHDDEMRMFLLDFMTYNIKDLLDSDKDKVKEFLMNLSEEVLIHVLQDPCLQARGSQKVNTFFTEFVMTYVKSFKVNANERFEKLKKLVEAIGQADIISKKESISLLTMWIELSDGTPHPQITQLINAASLVFDKLSEGEKKKLFLNVPYNIFLKIMDNDNLNVDSEKVVYEFILKYFQTHPDLSKEQRKELMNCVRLEYYPIIELNELKKNLPEEISKERLLKSLYARVLKTIDKPIRSMQVFRYKTDFDTNGILYWLGTNKLKDTYINPFDRKLVSITLACPLETQSYSIGRVISHIALPANLQRHSKSFVTIKFNTIAVQPTHYSLRHTNREKEALCNWDFMAKENDGDEWTTLTRHKNVTSLTGVYTTKTFPIEKTSTFYRYFKIQMTGPNTSNSLYLSMAGFEIYGKLMQLHTTDL
mmetsp:Transcript_2682/g.3863  ORF Transcript_2682/g.3863 Transcript_2682/m.3863 type:complete len:567 (-) Transcript_2682:2847-4547(-)